MVFGKKQNDEPTSKKPFRKLVDYDSYVQSKNRFNELSSQRKDSQRRVNSLEAQIGNAENEKPFVTYGSGA